MTPVLRHRVRRDLGFPASYAWIETHEFDLDGGGSDRDVLAALVAHERYDHDFLGEWGAERAGIHGRRRLSTVAAETFREREVGESREHLSIWGRVADPDVVDSGALSALLDEVLPVDATVYELPPAPEAAEHEFGWITGFGTGFHEFVVIAADRSRLTLVVATDD